MEEFMTRQGSSVDVESGEIETRLVDGAHSIKFAEVGTDFKEDDSGARNMVFEICASEEDPQRQEGDCASGS
jgi:hypothetical protein